MVDIFDEVSDDLRTERAVKLAMRYGVLLLLLLLLVLAGVGAQQYFTWHTGQENQKAATAFITITGPIDAAGSSITNDQRQADAKKLTDFAATAPAGYRTLANLRAAALYADAGQATQAQAVWTKIANDSGADVLLRDLATLLWAQNALGTAPDADVLARLKPISGSENPYHGLAQQTQALIYMREGKNDQAKALLSQLGSDPGAPDGVRNNADGLLAKLNG